MRILFAWLFCALIPALPASAVQPDPSPEYLGAPYWRWEGRNSRYAVANTPDGPCFHFTIDVLGPTYLIVDVIPCPQGVTVSVRQTCTPYVSETSYRSWADLMRSRDDAALWFRAMLDRADIAFEP